MLLEDERTEVLPELYIQSEPITMQRLRERRPSTIDAMLLARRVSKNNIDILADAWTIENTPGPNITDKETVLALGYMTYDAYYIDEHDSEWHDVGDSYNRSLGIGWEKNGLRGHIWTNEDNSTVVIGLKGTTPGSFIYYMLAYVLTIQVTGIATVTPRETTRRMTISLAAAAAANKARF